jgi:hypothetical protein
VTGTPSPGSKGSPTLVSSPGVAWNAMKERASDLLDHGKSSKPVIMKAGHLFKNGTRYYHAVEKSRDGLFLKFCDARGHSSNNPHWISSYNIEAVSAVQVHRQSKARVRAVIRLYICSYSSA